jgi:ribosomal protein L34
MTKQSLQRHKIREVRKRGFLTKMKTSAGRRLLHRRRLKGRSILIP